MTYVCPATGRTCDPELAWRILSSEEKSDDLVRHSLNLHGLEVEQLEQAYGLFANWLNQELEYGKTLCDFVAAYGLPSNLNEQDRFRLTLNLNRARAWKIWMTTEAIKAASTNVERADVHELFTDKDTARRRHAEEILNAAVEAY